jgi:excisionase family DNA binding protein
MSETIELISIKDAAKILGISVHTMYEIANSEDFPATVIASPGKGRKLYRINKTKFNNWIEAGGVSA